MQNKKDIIHEIESLNVMIVLLQSEVRAIRQAVEELFPTSSGSSGPPFLCRVLQIQQDETEKMLISIENSNPAVAARLQELLDRESAKLDD